MLYASYIFKLTWFYFINFVADKNTSHRYSWISCLNFQLSVIIISVAEISYLFQYIYILQISMCYNHCIFLLISIKSRPRETFWHSLLALPRPFKKLLQPELVWVEILHFMLLCFLPQTDFSCCNCCQVPLHLTFASSTLPPTAYPSSPWTFALHTPAVSVSDVVKKRKEEQE